MHAATGSCAKLHTGCLRTGLVPIITRPYLSFPPFHLLCEDVIGHYSYSQSLMSTCFGIRIVWSRCEAASDSLNSSDLSRSHAGVIETVIEKLLFCNVYCIFQTTGLIFSSLAFHAAFSSKWHVYET